MDLAVAAARRAFDQGPWPGLSHRQRAEYLRKLGKELAPRVPELQLAWTQQVGALAYMAPGMIGGAVAMVDYYAGLADTFPLRQAAQVLRRPWRGGGGARAGRRGGLHRALECRRS